MRVDATLRTCFPAIVCALIGAAAFLQAMGAGHLLAREALAGARPAHGPLHGAPALSAEPRDRSARDILARNPFDSITGPLLDPVGVVLPPRPDRGGASRDPYADPPCTA